MTKKHFKIKNIPAVLWGNSSKNIFIAIHGNMSHKEDEAIEILAKKAIERGYQVLSFDLPEHGERTDREYLCKAPNCVSDLLEIISYTQSNLGNNISIFACSLGAYFTLLACRDIQLRQCLFLSPLLDMKRMIDNMMTWFDISKERLELEKEIETPIGQTLYWDYYCYVQANPIETWEKPTSILYGSSDNLCEFDVLSKFVKDFNCKLDILENSEHFFHTDEQMAYFSNWLEKNVDNIK